MIEGQVDDTLTAVIAIDALASDNSTHTLSAVIDTGFDGELTLSAKQIRDLELPQIGARDIDLGDDSTTTTEVHLGVILWDGKPRPIMVLRAGDTPLVGMELLEHHRLTIDVRRGAIVSLEQLP